MEAELLAIQRLYPQIYRACHARHVRSRARNAESVSERDHSLLAHLSPHEGVTQTDLARHLGIGLPTLSEAVRRLERLGYLRREHARTDRRASWLFLSERGAAALRGGSVLDDARLAVVLARLTAAERRRAVAGLELLARACRDSRLKEADQ